MTNVVSFRPRRIGATEHALKYLLAFLQQRNDADAAKRSKEIEDLFSLLGEHIRRALAFHYGAPALPDGDWR